MSLAASATLMGRKVAEGLMESSCVIQRAGAVTTDANGVDSPALTTIYTGKCRLRLPDSHPSEVIAVGQNIAKQSPILSLPVVGSESVLPDDIVTITSPLDAVAVTARISGLQSQTHSTARRFTVEVSK